MTDVKVGVGYQGTTVFRPHGSEVHEERDFAPLVSPTPAELERADLHARLAALEAHAAKTDPAYHPPAPPHGYTRPH